MRWFIEVSRIGEDAAIEKYTLEAKQWQAALQEARKLRGDTGPLSKFSIELLEHGYRAVDPAQQIRYVVNKAPGDAPLSERPAATEAAGSFPKVPAQARAPVIRASEPAPSTDPMAAEPLKTDPMAAGPRTDPMAALPPESVPPNTAPAAAAAPAPGSKPAHAKPPRPLLTVPEDSVPRPKLNATASAPAAGGLDTQLSSTQPLTPPPEAKEKPKDKAPTAVQLTQRSIEAAREPDFQLIRKREEEPSDKVPITYREYAYAVRPGTDKKSAEVLLWLRFREVTLALKDRTGQKFVQLAVFDHVFEKKPARPPIATLAWKDWRGEPVIQFPEAPAGRSAPPPPSSTPPPRPAAHAPAPAATAPAVKSSPAAAAVMNAVPPTTPSAAPAPSVAVVPSVIIAPQAPVPQPAVTAPAPVPVPSGPVPSAAAPSAAAPPVPSGPVPSASAPSITVASPMPEAVKPPTPSAGPTVPIRRRAGEDLIGELFEGMHDLHFMPDMMSGVDFVLGILNNTLPSDAILIHIFDINTRQFIIVRALGPSPHAVVLHRTPDQEELFRRAMRSTRATRTAKVEDEASYKDGRWGLLGVTVACAMLGPVQLAGRYLGAIELANPLGGEPYSEHESHALDYICEQFAEFLAARPIVVDPDVVLGKG